MSEKETRPWGWFETIETGTNYKVKKLFIKAGCSISLQLHDHRDEHWVIVEGRGLFKQGYENNPLIEAFVGVGEYIFIPKLRKHKITAFEDLTLIEVQMGICEEADIKRFQDDYGRV
jgi:mannose-1-phosphate guanylyltransferase/mannose-6-phosphate isomerase